jgi:phosphoesterase RecJ-like protein
MSLDEALLREAARCLNHAHSVLIVSHIRPDGDAVGSLIGLALALEQKNLQVQMVIGDGVPASLRHLEGSNRVLHKPQREFDLIITVDCSDLERAGIALKEKPAPDINIDHHVTNTKFARINLVDDQAAATSEMIVDILPEFGLQLSPAVAAALLTGLITDTIGFRTSNVSPRTLRHAARLMETGVDMPYLYRRALINRSYESVKFWGSGLINLERDGRLIWTTLTMDDRKLAGYPGRDDADLINVLSSIDEVDIAMVFVEQPNGRIKVSWRAQPGFDVAEIATVFGGGGHPAASGVEVSGNLSDIKTAVLEKTRSLINGGYRV